MGPFSALYSWGPIKGGACQPLGLIVVHCSAWVGWLFVACIAVSSSGQTVNSASATTLHVAADPYGSSDEQQLLVARHRSSPAVSIYRSGSLKAGHGENCSICGGPLSKAL